MNSSGVVHIVDNDRAAAAAMSALFASVALEPRVHSCAGDFLKTFSPCGPCCVVLEMRMPELSGLEVLARLRQRAVWAPAIVATAHGSVDCAVRAMKLGAAEFLEKPVDEGFLLERVQHLVDLSRDKQENIRICSLIRHKIASLSTREYEVLHGVLRGHSNKEMAREFGVSPKAIEIYRSKLMTKMAAQSLAGLVAEVLCCPGHSNAPLRCHECHDASAVFRRAIGRCGVERMKRTHKLNGVGVFPE
jgi:two-component system, LuxR family, response regulator FixJ